ncbi:MAG: DsbA family protein [Chloroflexi bacterium]|nr:DsbA family protein [Chloroflexota bacterium]
MTHEQQPPLTRRERRSLERRDRPIRDRSRASTRRPPKRPAWQSPFVLVSAAALVVAVAIIVLNQKPKPSDSGGFLITPPLSYSADIVDGTSLGRADAPVVMEVYSDFQCPFCARLVEDMFPTLKSELVDAGVLRIVSRDIAIVGRGDPNESVELAAGGVCAARQDRYWQFHDFVFYNQGGENVGDHDEAFIAGVASRAGVDRTEWDTCMDDDTVRDAIRSETQSSLGRGINGTPTLVLNGGNPISPIPALEQLIAQIRALAAAGSPTPVP